MALHICCSVVCLPTTKWKRNHIVNKDIFNIHTDNISNSWRQVVQSNRIFLDVVSSTYLIDTLLHNISSFISHKYIPLENCCICCCNSNRSSPHQLFHETYLLLVIHGFNSLSSLLQSNKSWYKFFHLSQYGQPLSKKVPQSRNSIPLTSQNFIKLWSLLHTDRSILNCFSFQNGPIWSTFLLLRCILKILNMLSGIQCIICVD